ncbi:MAG: hypothetical protein IJA42_04270 [Bacteroidales bacterium]|nr:hypothetical protein [Bacteroidales bacterium]
MKKLIMTVIFALFMGMTMSAQSDGFFAYSDVDNYRGGSDEWGALPTLPGSHGFTTDQDAVPLGSGLLLLGGMAILYARRKKINN